MFLSFTILIAAASLPPASQCLSYAVISLADSPQARVKYDAAQGQLHINKAMLPPRALRQLRALTPVLIGLVEENRADYLVELTRRSTLVELSRKPGQQRIKLCELRGPALSPVLRRESMLPLTPAMVLPDGPAIHFSPAWTKTSSAAHRKLGRALARWQPEPLRRAAQALDSSKHSARERGDAQHVLSWFCPSPTRRRIEALERALVAAPRSPLAPRSRYLLMRWLVRTNRTYKAAALIRQMGAPKTTRYGVLLEAAALMSSPKVPLDRLRSLAEAPEQTRSYAQRWLGMIQWRRGDIQSSLAAIISSSEHLSLADQDPSGQLVLAEALRVSGQRDRALKVLLNLVRTPSPLCAVSAMRASDLLTAQGQLGPALRVLDSCKTVDASDQAVLRMRASEMNDLAQRRGWRSIYTAVLSDSHMSWFHPEIRMRWARNAYLLRLDEESLHQASLASSAPEPMLLFLSKQAMRQSLRQGKPLRAAVIYQNRYTKHPDNESRRLAAEAFSRLGLGQQCIEVLQILIQETEIESVADQLRLLQAYRQTGQVSRASLVARHLEEIGVPPSETSAEDVPPAPCWNPHSTYSHARCLFDQGSKDEARALLRGQGTLSLALDLALTAHAAQGD